MSVDWWFQVLESFKSDVKSEGQKLNNCCFYYFYEIQRALEGFGSLWEAVTTATRDWGHLRMCRRLQRSNLLLQESIRFQPAPSAWSSTSLCKTHLPHSSASCSPASQQFPVRVCTPPLSSQDALLLLLSEHFMVYLLQLPFHDVFIIIAFAALLLVCKLPFSHPHLCDPAPGTQCLAWILVVLYPQIYIRFTRVIVKHVPVSGLWVSWFGVGPRLGQFFKSLRWLWCAAKFVNLWARDT